MSAPNRVYVKRMEDKWFSVTHTSGEPSDNNFGATSYTRTDIHEAEITALKAEIERLRDPWWPIETAPRDIWFLAFEDGAIYKAKFYSDDYDDGKIAYSVDCGQPVVEGSEPTHWCELPPVPQAQAKIEEITND